MGGTANPVWSMQNPGAMPNTGTGTSNSAVPIVPFANPSQTNQNPYGGFPAYGSPYGNPTPPTSIGVSPGTSSAPGGGGSTPGNLVGAGTGGVGSLTPGQLKALGSQLDKTYGKGMGALLEQFLSSGAGYNPQVLSDLVAQLQPQFAQQKQDLLGSFSAGGNRFGSGAQIGMADLESMQNTDVSNMAASLYEQSIQNYMTILEGTSGADASRIAATPSTFDDITSFLSAVKPNFLPVPGA